MTDEERDQTLLALGRYQHREFARLLAIMIGLAAEINAEELRTALSKVFDLSAIDGLTKQAALAAEKARGHAYDAKQLLQVIHADLEDLEKRIDAMNLAIDAVERRLKKAATWAAGWQEKLRQAAQGKATGQ